MRSSETWGRNSARRQKSQKTHLWTSLERRCRLPLTVSLANNRPHSSPGWYPSKCQVASISQQCASIWRPGGACNQEDKTEFCYLPSLASLRPVSALRMTQRRGWTTWLTSTLLRRVSACQRHRLVARLEALPVA